MIKGLVRERACGGRTFSSLLRALLLIAISCSACLSLAQLDPASPWPRPHGNNASTGQGGGNGAHGILKWTFGGSCFNPIVGSDGTVYTGNSGGELAFDPDDGTIKWFASTNFPLISTSAALDKNGHLFVGDIGDLYAFDASTGAEIWTQNVGAAGSIAIASDGSLIVPLDSGVIESINPSNGRVNWQFGAFPGFTTSGDVTIDSNGNIYFHDGTGTYYSLSSSGGLNWSDATGSGPLFAPCVDSNGDIYLVSQSGGIQAVDPSNTPRWTNGPNGAISPGVDTNGNILYGDQAGVFADLAASNGNPLWQDNFLPSGAPAISPDGTIYIGDSSGSNFDAIDENTGDIKWQLPNISNANGAAIGADGSVYFTDSNNMLYAVGTNSISSLTASPSTVIGGGSTNVVLQLASAAPANGYTANFSSDNPDASVISSVSLSSGSKGISIPVSTNVVSSTEVANITAQIDGDSVSVGITLAPQDIVGFYVSPNSVTGGHGTSGVVQLDSPAPSGGTSVTLQSNSPLGTMPSSVNVPAGSTGVSFAVTTTAASVTATVTFTATLASGSTYTTTLTVNPYPLSNFYVSPNTVVGGHSTSGVVQLAGIAGGKGDVVGLQSNSVYAAVPGSAIVPAGNTGVSFPITTSVVSTPQSVTLTATLGSSTLTAGMFVEPSPVANFYLSPSTVVGGATTRGVVQLSGPAGASGDTVTINYGGMSTSAPTTVTVPQGQTGASFAIPTSLAAAPATFTFTASFNGGSKTTGLTLTGYPLSNFYVSPSTIAAGQFGNGVVQLAGPAGSSGTTVSLQSASSDISFPSSVKVQAGQTGVSFSIQATFVNSSENVSITASLNSTSLQANVTLVPIQLSNFYLSPSTVVGGTTTHGVVQLTGPALPGGDIITLVCSDPNVIIPGEVVVPSGQTGLSFPIRTLAVSSQDVVTITAEDGSVTLQATLTLNP